MPEYWFEYNHRADKENGYDYGTFYWTRIYNLPDARKKAMWLIAHGVAVPNNFHRFPKGTVGIIVGNEGRKGKNREIGAVLRINGEMYWRTVYGGYHKINKDGTIQSKTVSMLLPMNRKAISRRY